METIKGLLFIISPVLFFVGIYDLYLRGNHTQQKTALFIVNAIMLAYLLIDSYNEPYIELYYGTLGVLAFLFALVGVVKYFKNKKVTKEKKLQIGIYILVFLIIGFGMCSTTGIFGF